MYMYTSLLETDNYPAVSKPASYRQIITECIVHRKEGAKHFVYFSEGLKIMDV